MKVVRLTIENYRSIRYAQLHFEGHTLLVGPNNVGKSTICEALELALSPDRLGRNPVVEEYDFYNAHYMADDGSSTLIRIEVILTELTDEVLRLCLNNLEHWHIADRRLLQEGELALVAPLISIPCLRILALCKYNSEEDEFEGNTYFAHSPDVPEGEFTRLPKLVKRSFGFLYLRALRTGSRALTLERGSLLDIILRMKQIRTGLWEDSRKRLRDLTPPIDQAAQDLTPVLDAIEQRLADYIPVQGTGRATRLFVSQLTREHLRKTISFFLSLTADQCPVPFQEAGTGTLNTLVLALLTFIAEIKKENVIFAMEEPEIALPPHTQRRIIKYLLEETNQCFVTSHSPYVIERFEPEQIFILARDNTGTLAGNQVSLSAGLKAKTFRRHVRRALAEAMLGRAVIVAEGITELVALNSVADSMAAANPDLFPFDLAGVTIISSDGDGSLSEYGSFFQSLGLTVFAYCDNKVRSAAEMAKLAASFLVVNQIPYTGCESLLASEISLDNQWRFLDVMRDSGRHPHIGIPGVRPADDTTVRELTIKTLKAGKGEGLAAELIECCSDGELPPTMVAFLGSVFAQFPRPQPRPTSTDSSSQGVAETTTASSVSTTDPIPPEVEDSPA